MKMNFVKAALGLNGAPLTERGAVVMINEVIANTLVTQDADNNPMFQYELARKLYDAKGEIEFSESEKMIIMKLCESGRLIVLIAAQVLMILNNAKK
jgi:hypothetical protein